MENLLTQIIKTDVRAREKLKEAEDYRKEKMAQLPIKKEEIVKEENQKAIDEALKRSRSSLTTAANKLEKTKEKNKLAEAQMETLYNEKGDQWVRDMVKNITTP